jgi:hypothetical protein
MSVPLYLPIPAKAWRPCEDARARKYHPRASSTAVVQPPCSTPSSQMLLAYRRKFQVG